MIEKTPAPDLPLVRPGQPVKAEHFNALVEAIEANRETKSPELPPFSPYIAPFQPVAIRKDGNDWKCFVWPGYMGEWAAPTGAYNHRTPTIGGTAIDAAARPELTLAGITSYNYLVFDTDDQGVFQGTAPTVQSFATTQAITHHVPEDDDGSEVEPEGEDPTDGGTAGQYYIPLFKTESNGLSGDDEAPRVDPTWRFPDFLWPQQLLRVVGTLGTGTAYVPDGTEETGETGFENQTGQDFEGFELLDLSVRFSVNQTAVGGVEISAHVAVPIPNGTVSDNNDDHYLWIENTSSQSGEHFETNRGIIITDSNNDEGFTYTPP